MFSCSLATTLASVAETASQVAAVTPTGGSRRGTKAVTPASDRGAGGAPPAHTASSPRAGAALLVVWKRRQ